jgi:hypothetical protein
MKIKTKTVVEPDDYFSSIIPHSRGDVRNIIASGIVFCCDKMKKAIKNRYIIFGEDDRFLNKDSNLNIIKTSCYPSGTVMDTQEISYCPFCGSKIEIENIETVEAD